ncbi:hypothetical protein F511_39593 [Dorcoceras hygrometricum]|uniref:Uncharacterized protein n=1 Tax=Dorcoceras hygrometricum TaxID=472368 RepID=A0A2Z7C8F5_9LAMI|nr:hypothetical protein F511_39593 [Dorcoceras hygrometricum]
MTGETGEVAPLEHWDVNLAPLEAEPETCGVLVGFGPAVGRCVWRRHQFCLKSSSNADVDSRRWCISVYPTVASDQLLVKDLCCSDFVVAAVCGNYSSEAVVALHTHDHFPFRCCSRALLLLCFLTRMQGRATIPHSHLPAGLLALMRRVVNYHSSWVGQQQVELLMHLIFRCGVKMSG